MSRVNELNALGCIWLKNNLVLVGKKNIAIHAYICIYAHTHIYIYIYIYIYIQIYIYIYARDIARIFNLCIAVHVQAYKTGRFGDRTHTQTYVALRQTMSPNTMVGSSLICYSTKELHGSGAYPGALLLTCVFCCCIFPLLFRPHQNHGRRWHVDAFFRTHS